MALPEPGDWSSIIFVPSLEKIMFAKPAPCAPNNNFCFIEYFYLTYKIYF